MKKKIYAPIIIFSYNRPNSLKYLIKSIKKNSEAKNSSIYFFQDNFKNMQDVEYVNKCKKLIKNTKGFKKVRLILRKSHYGFYKNFINGLKFFFMKHNQGIILEDDLVVSKYFLKFMNQSLIRYKNDKRVWSISGWNYDIPLKSKYDAYFMRNFISWGWATWANRFNKYKKKPDKIIKNWDRDKIKKFNLDNNYDYFSQILRNQNNLLNSFGVFWYATIFENKGLCLAPLKSMVVNTGWNSKATHTKIKNKTFTTKKLSQKKKFKFPINVEEDKQFFEKVKNYISGEKKNMIKKIYTLLKTNLKNL